MNIDQLQRQFGIDGQVRIQPGAGDLPCIKITHALANATIYLHGAHVTQYQPAAQPDLLFLSEKSHFSPDQPIRGGIPICFPWFGPRQGHPESPAHGFARILPWQLESTSADAKSVQVVLTLESNEKTRASWDHDFTARYTITIGRTLNLALQVTNNGTTPFSFEEALHTYFRVHDIHQARIDGLSGTCYLDKTDALKQKLQPAGAIEITSETDRVYLNTVSRCVIHDRGGRRRITIDKEGSQNTVVWNPWINKSRAMADFGDDEWPGMLCVETANVGCGQVTLQPGASHTMTATIEPHTTDKTL